MRSKLICIDMFVVRYFFLNDRVNKRDFVVVDYIFFENMYGIW